MAYYDPNSSDRYYDPIRNARQDSDPIDAIVSTAKTMVGYGILSSAASAVAGFVSKGIGKGVQKYAMKAKAHTQFAKHLSKVKSPNMTSVIKSFTPARQMYTAALKGQRPYRHAMARRTRHLKSLKDNDWLRANKETFTSVFKDRKTFMGTAGSLFYKHGVQGSAIFYGIDTMMGHTDHIGLEKKPIWDVPGHVMNYMKYMKSEAPAFMAWGVIGGTAKGIQGSIGMGLRGFFDKNDKFKDKVIGGLAALTRPYFGQRGDIFNKNIQEFNSAIQKKFITRTIANIKGAWGTGVTQLINNARSYFTEARQHVVKAVGSKDSAGGIGTRSKAFVDQLLADTRAIWNIKREAALTGKNRGLAEIPGMAVMESFENLASMKFHANKPGSSSTICGGGKNLVEGLIQHNKQIKPKSFIASVLGLKATKVGDVVNTDYIGTVSSKLSRYFPDKSSEPLKQAISSAYMGKHFYRKGKFHVDLSYFSPIHMVKRGINKLGGMNFNLLVGVPPVGRNISLGGIMTTDTMLSDNIAATTFRKSVTGTGLIVDSNKVNYPTGTGVRTQTHQPKNLKQVVSDAYGDDGVLRDSFGVTYVGRKFYAVDGTNIMPLDTKETILKYSHPSIFGMAGEGKTSNLRRWMYHNDKELQAAGNFNMYKHMYDAGEPTNPFQWFMKKMDWTPPRYARSIVSKLKNILTPGRIHTNGKTLDHKQELIATAAEGIFGKDMRKDGLHEHIQALYHLYGHSTQEVSTLLKRPHIFNELAERSLTGLKGDASIMHSDETFLSILNHNKRLLGGTIDKDNIFYELTKSPELKTIYNTAINYPNKASERVIFQRHGRLSKLTSMDLLKTRYVSSVVERQGGPEAFINAADYLLDKNLVSKNQAKAMKTHGYLTTLFRDGRLANQSVHEIEQKGADVAKEIVGKYKDQHNVWLQDMIDYVSDTDLRTFTLNTNKQRILTGATFDARKLGSEFQGLHDNSPFTSFSLDPHGQMRYKSAIGRGMDIASERLTNLVNDLTGLKKNPFKYGDGFVGSAKYLTTRMGQVAGAMLAYRTLDSVVAANPAFDQTMLDAGITGFVADEVAKTHLLTSKVANLAGIAGTGRYLEGLMPGFTTSAPGAVIGGALNWKRGALATVGGAFRGAIVNRVVSPLMPDMTKTYEQLESEYSGESQVPIIDNKMWYLGTTPWQGRGVKGWQPNWYVRAKSRWEASDTLYGSELRATLHKPIFPTGLSVGDFFDPYYNERFSFHSRPFLQSGDWGAEAPLGVGPIIAGTIGRLIKPTKMMHREFMEGHEVSGDEVSAIRPPSYRESRGMMATSTFNPKKFSALSANQGTMVYSGSPLASQNMADRALDDFESALGLVGFGAHSMRQGLAPRPVIVPTIETAGRIASQSRGYYDMNLGGLGLFCMPQDGKVLTPKGLKNIIDINIGDIVYDKDYKEQKVTNKFERVCNTSEYLYTVTTEFSSFQLTGNHPVAIIHNNTWVWKLAEDITIKDQLIFPWNDTVIPIKSITAVNCEGLKVYDIEVEHSHCFIGDNVLLHNSEGIRRFITKPDWKRYGINPVPNLMPQWVGEKLTRGDAYSKITRGELRLPGAAYNKTHPDIDHTLPGRSSMLGGTVEHQVQYFTGLLPPVLKEQYDIMNTGTEYHENVQNWLAAEGLLIKAESLVYDIKHDVSGHVDAIIREGQGGRGRRALEIKTISDEGILKLKGPKYEHVSQINFYLHQLGLKKGSIMYVNRDNPSDFRLYEVNYNRDRYSQDMEKLQKARMIASQMLAKGIEGDGYGYSYSWLDRMTILGDVSPHSPEFKEAKFIVEKQIKAGTLTQKQITKYQKAMKQRKAVVRKHELYPMRFRNQVMSPSTEVNIQSLNENIKASAEYSLPERMIGSAWEEFTNTNTFLVNKFFAFKDPLEHYKQYQLYGKEFVPWTDPYGSFIEPGTRRALSQEDPIRGALSWGLGPAYFVGGRAAAIYGGIAGGLYGAAHGMVRKATGSVDIPDNIQREREINDYFDELKYYKNQRMAQLAGGLDSKKYSNQSRATLTSILQDGGKYADLFRAAPYRERPYLEAWLNETDPMMREEILRFAPQQLGEGIKTFWHKNDSEEGTSNFVDNTSSAIAGPRKVNMYTNQEMDPNIYLEDVKLKTIRKEGQNEHDFGLGWQEQMIRVQNDLDRIQGSDIDQTPAYPETTDVSAVKSSLYSLFNKLGLRNNTRVYVNNHIDDDNNVEIVIKRDRLIEIQNALNNRQRFM